MFDQIFRKTFTINKHLNAPLVEERLEYLKRWHKLGRANNTITSIAQYLLRIICFFIANEYIYISQIG